MAGPKYEAAGPKYKAADPKYEAAGPTSAILQLHLGHFLTILKPYFNPTSALRTSILLSGSTNTASGFSRKGGAAGGPRFL